VDVKLELSGDLKGYMPHKDPATGKGNHIHVILDNQPYEAYYDTSQPFELRNVTDGKHTLRVFPSRPWHESYKNDGAFQMIEFTVKGGGDASKPTTTKTVRRWRMQLRARTRLRNSRSLPTQIRTPARHPLAKARTLLLVRRRGRSCQTFTYLQPFLPNEVVLQLATEG